MDQQTRNITRYLENEMTPEERADFEMAIRQNKALAKAVKFQGDLGGFLSREQPEMESKLSKLGDKYILNHSSGKAKNHWWILTLLLVGLLAVGLILFNKNAKKTIEHEWPIIENQISIPIDSVENNLNKTLEESSPPTLEKEIAEPKTTKPSTKPPIAQIDKTKFEPNPFMEDLMSDMIRSRPKEDSIFIFRPKRNTIFKGDQMIEFILKGKTNVAPPYQFFIYSNRQSDIEGDVRRFEKTLKGKPEQSEFLFEMTQNMGLEKGLYYWVLQKENSRNFLYISRFRKE